MDDIEIPECNDGEWQSKMLRELDKRLQDIEVELQIADRLNVAPLMRAQKIVEALREYSGF